MSTRRQRSKATTPGIDRAPADFRDIDALDDRLWAPLAECGVRHFGPCCWEPTCCIEPNQGRCQD